MSDPSTDKIELVELAGGSLPIEDRRRRMPEPLPVRLVVVEDARLFTRASLEPELDGFYVRLLQFEKEPREEDAVVYRADNARVFFQKVEVPPHRQSLRPLGVEVISLAATENKLIDAEIEYSRQKGLTPGQDVLLLLDPAGNWVELSEAPKVW